MDDQERDEDDLLDEEEPMSEEESKQVEKLFKAHVLLIGILYAIAGFALIFFGGKNIYLALTYQIQPMSLHVGLGVFFCLGGLVLIFKLARLYINMSKGGGNDPGQNQNPGPGKILG